MCFYRSYYYTSCRHPEIILLDFCRHATDFPPEDKQEDEQQSRSVSLDGEGGTYDECLGRQAGGGVDGGSSAAAAAVDGSDTGAGVASGDTLFTHAVPFNTTTSPPHTIRGSSTITAGPGGVSSSLLLSEQTSPPHNPAPPSPDTAMAGLPMFSGSSLKNFFSGAGSAQQNYQKQPPVSPGSASTRSRTRQAGIRENTDESFDLPHSNDILQHLSESYRGRDAQTFQDAEGLEHYYTIEAELDQLREDVTRMRERAEQGASVHRDDLQQHASPPQPQTKVPIPNLSTAARLQKIHEAADRDAERARNAERGEILQHPPSPPPPSPLEFPSLGLPMPKSTAATPTELRKPSYASAAGSGVPKATSQASLAGPRSAPLPSSFPSTPRQSLESSELDDEDSSVIRSPPSAEQEAWQTPNELQPAKQSPHFAQPTKSFARRAGETLRREASSSPSKAAQDSYSKAGKANEPQPATEKRLAQRQQKRKSLPGGWLGDTEPNSESTSTRVSPGNVASAGRPSYANAAADNLQRGYRPPVSASTKSSDPPAKSQPAPAQIRKKASGYMAPTSATTQRVADTIRKEKPKRNSASPKKTNKKDLTIDTTQAVQDYLTRSPEIATALSDTSSVQFILDRPRSGTPLPGSPRSKFGQRSRGGSPTKLPRPYRNSNPSAEMAVSSPDSGPLMTSLPKVANTTTVRRTSHSHILKPIMDRLSAQGLARGRASSVQSQPSLVDSVSNALHTAREGVRRDGGSDGTSDAVFEYPATIPVPPRVRVQREARVRRTTMETVTSEGSGTTAKMPVQQKAAMPDLLDPSIVPGSSSLRPSPASSLRATASEFTPMSSFSEVLEPQTSPTIEELTTFRSPYEWLMTPPEDRRMILQLRQLRQNNFRSATSIDNPLPIPDWSTMDWNSYNGLPCQPGSSTGASVAVDENGSPHTVPSAQGLKPVLSPGKKTVHWTTEDADGKATPAVLGRAPAPKAPPGLLESSEPAFSPRSYDTSPLKTPSSVSSSQGWSIGSAGSPNYYGWKGGDGKEIRFVGYGPYAEKDPNSAVSFEFRGVHKSLLSTLSDGDANENAPPVAPRSQRQWAGKMGYPRVPCQDVQVMNTGESIPFASRLPGYCHDCY